MPPLEPQRSGAVETAEAPARPQHGWAYKLGVILFVIVCFEVGVFLVIFPWTPQWGSNHLANSFPWLRGYWSNSYFRGALSGLGVVNIYIALGELLRLRGSSAPPPGNPRVDSLPPADKMKASTL
jgi:hypothetical protein